MTPGISQITRRDIVDAINEEKIAWNGRLGEVQFLARIFRLDDLPSRDSRFRTAAQDIALHREHFCDWDDDWVFHDGRLDLMGCDDEEFMRFLCETIHPEVRRSASEARQICETYNRYLENDGFQLVEEAMLSGRPVYAGRHVGVIHEAVLNARRTLAGIDHGYIEQQLLRMDKAVVEDPDLAIGTAKEFIETCCRTILEERGVDTLKTLDISRLTKRTSEELRLTPADIPDEAKAAEKIRRILGNLASITQGMAELRNHYGTGHGRSAHRRGLDSRHARLAVGAATALGVFLFETHKAQLSETRGHRRR